MVKYDYSLDVGQSMETDEKLKQKEQEEPQGCCKVSQESLEVGDEQTEKKEEPKNEPEKKAKLKEEKVEITPISFEKAKLISDFEGEKKEEPEKKKDAPKEEILEEQDDEPEEEQKDPEEDEKDVNEFLEDSFSKETKKYETYNNKPREEKASKKRSWKLPAAIAIIILLIGFFGYFYIAAEDSPTGTVTAAPEIELQEPPIIVTNITEPPAIIPNITETKNINEEKEPVMLLEEPETKNVSDALEMLSLALKDQ